MKTLLVTGGCGFIGSNFIRRFLKTHADWKILNFDKLSYCGNRENTRGLEGTPQYEFLQGDICDRDAVFGAVQRAGGVVHFAAETHVDRSIADAHDFLKTNILGTAVLLEAARHRNLKRFIHISTDEVYGSLEKGEADENAPLRPSSPYSASKASGDLLVQSYLKTYGTAPIIIRSTNNFGPYQFPEKVIPLFITNLLENKKVPLYGEGKNRRDWIYVEDNCAAIELVFDKGEEGQIYNVGAGNEMSNSELTLEILKLMGKPQEMIRKVADRPGHDFRYAVDTSRIRALGFKPRESFQEGLRKTVDWYSENRGWWQPLKRDAFTLK